MIGPVEYITSIESQVRDYMAKRDFKKAKELLDRIIENVKNSEFFELEKTDLLLILKKVYLDLVKIGEYGEAIDLLYFTYKNIRKRNVENELLMILDSIPENTDLSKYLSSLNEIAGSSERVREKLKNFNIDKKMEVTANNVPKEENNKEQANSLLKESKKLVDEGKVEQAMQMLKSYLKDNNAPEALKIMQDIQLLQEKIILTKIGLLNIKNPLSRELLKKLLYGKFEEVNNDITGMLVNSKDSELWLIKAYISMKQGNSSYINFINYAIKLNPDIAKSKLYEALFVRDLKI